MLPKEAGETVERKATVRRVVLAGLARLFAEALAEVLASRGAVIVSVVDLDAVTDDVRVRPADVIILGDADDDQGRLADVAESLRDVAPTATTIVVTGTIDLEMALRAESRGIDAIVPSDAPLAYLVESLAMTSPSPRAARTVAELPVRSRLELVSEPPATLTPREIEVLRLLAEGLAARAIAERVELSVHTVRDHIKSLLRKLAAHSQLEAVVTATRRGLV